MSYRKDGFEDRREHFEKLRELARQSREQGQPVPPMEERGVRPFADPEQHVIEYTTKTREYHFPFNYRNIAHHTYCEDPSNSGLEMNPVNTVIGRSEADGEPADYLELTEGAPIVRVVVIGSACTPPGYVCLEADACEGFRRPEEVVELMPLRFRIEGLWGTHVRGDCWIKPNTHGGPPLPQHFVENWPYCHQTDFAEKNVFTGVTGANVPNTGMSCAIFEIPASHTVRIMGGSLTYGWLGDKGQGDIHYSFRMIRTNVLVSYEAAEED